MLESSARRALFIGGSPTLRPSTQSENGLLCLLGTFQGKLHGRLPADCRCRCGRKFLMRDFETGENEAKTREFRASARRAECSRYARGMYLLATQVVPCLPSYVNIISRSPHLTRFSGERIARERPSAAATPSGNSNLRGWPLSPPHAYSRILYRFVSRAGLYRTKDLLICRCCSSPIKTRFVAAPDKFRSGNNGGV
jgi:hypothetical protein